MQNNYKLLVEQPNYELDILVDEKNRNEEKSLYISGPYLMAETKNKNGRIYNLDEMAREVERYNKEMVETNRSLGELNHPASVEVNPERSCHMIIEIKQDGNSFIGKSKILNTPLGILVRNLINDGVRLGVSSRALGKVSEDINANHVTGFKFIAEDIVHDPSVDIAFVNGILESKEWMIKCDGSICEYYDQFESGLRNLPKKDVNAYIAEQVIAFINNLKSRS